MSRLGRRYCVLATLLMGVLMYSESEARVYKVLSIHHKVAQGKWDGLAEERKSIVRQESHGGQWALEKMYFGDKTEGWVKSQLLDSAGTVLWKGETGDRQLLSTSAPAFAVASDFGPDRQIYNADVGHDPVFESRATSASRLFQSGNGLVFAFAVGDTIEMAAIDGERQGTIELAKGMSLGPTALAYDGAYVALVEWAHDVRRERIPAHYHVLLYDSNAVVLGRIGDESDRYLPRALALSSDGPPRIAVATDRGVSLWSPQGDAIWSDSTAFVLPERRLLVKAAYVTDRGHVLAVTTTLNAQATFWAWDSTGTREAQLDLPSEFDAKVQGADFIGATDATVTIQSYGEILTVGWTDE